jgi:hypothetical protein
MANRTNGTALRPIGDAELTAVAGGQGIDVKTKLPNYRGPKVGDWLQGKSIAQADTIDNVDGLP